MNRTLHRILSLLAAALLTTAMLAGVRAGFAAPQAPSTTVVR